MGALDALSDYFTISRPRKKRKPMQTVEIKVKMDCDGCERRVKNAVSNMKGAKQVEVNRKQSKVTVTGYVEPNKVLKKVKSTGKKAEIWPYVPYNLAEYSPPPPYYYKSPPPPSSSPPPPYYYKSPPPPSPKPPTPYYYKSPGGCSLVANPSVL